MGPASGLGLGRGPWGGQRWLSIILQQLDGQGLFPGSRFGDWQAPAPVKVLYIDGEMPPDLIRDRCKGLEASDANLEFLNHEILFERTGKVLNITNREWSIFVADAHRGNGQRFIVLADEKAMTSTSSTIQTILDKYVGAATFEVIQRDPDSDYHGIVNFDAKWE